MQQKANNKSQIIETWCAIWPVNPNPLTKSWLIFTGLKVYHASSRHSVSQLLTFLFHAKWIASQRTTLPAIYPQQLLANQKYQEATSEV